MQVIMPSRKPYSWVREFDPQLDSPPLPGSTALHADTVQNLARLRIPVPPMGEFVYQQTREIEITGPIGLASGRTHNQWVYYHKNGKQFVRAFVKPRDPATGSQTNQRLRMKQVQVGWNQMTQEQREAWDAFAATIKRLAPYKSPRGRGHRCHRLYQSAQLSRLAMGLPLRNDAPTRKVTGSVSAIDLVAAPAAGQLAFRVFHQGKPCAGLRIMVDMTPPMPSTRRCPRPNELTRAGANELDSYFPLGANGATYVLDQTRYQPAPGQRFGLQVTIVSEEGLRSRPCFATHLIGVAPSPGSVEETAAAEFQTQANPSHSAAEPAVVASGFFGNTPPAAEVHRRHREMFEGFRNRVDEDPEEVARREAEVKLLVAERKRDALEREQRKAHEDAQRLAEQQKKIDARKAARARTWLALVDR
jgi:hypothetical protein